MICKKVNLIYFHFTYIITGTCQHLYIKAQNYTGTQVMAKGGKYMHFMEYKNQPSGGWGRIKKYDHEWYVDSDNIMSIINFHDKQNITLISSYWHGSEMDQAKRKRSGQGSIVTLPKMVKGYSNGKIGVDVGDQQLRDKRSFADQIRSHGWN